MCLKEFSKLAAACPMQKTYQIFADYGTTGSDVLPVVHAKTAYVTTPLGESGRNLSRPAIIKLEQEGDQLAKCNIII